MADERISKPKAPPPQRRWDSHDDDFAPPPNVRASGSSTTMWLILGLVGGGVLLSGVCVFAVVAFMVFEVHPAPRPVAARPKMVAMKVNDIQVAKEQAPVEDLLLRPQLPPPDAFPDPIEPPNEIAPLLVIGAPKAGQRHVETAGGFSYIPPAGWNVQAFGKLKYKVAVGPAANGFASNINVADEMFEGPQDAYVKASIASLHKAFDKLKVLKQEEFKTAEGLPGIRLIVSNDQKGQVLRQTFYFFGNGNTKTVFTSSALADGGEKLDAVFEASAKSFRYEKK